MADAPTSQVTAAPTIDEQTSAPSVRVLLTHVEGADLETALAVVGRQAYEPAPEIVVVGADQDVPEGVGTAGSLEEAIGGATSDTDYLWLLHSDARPRPDALHALVSEVERADAALGGSKLLVAGSPDVLESVGSATDVFGEPYTGLDEGEIDLQQYDVVREVAFVGSASMLVRRDLAQGLKGLDDLLPPVAAGLDFSQRARLAGGRVISVPSSEVYHQGRCEQRFRGWREQAGRLRAMVTAYSPLTLLWLLPYDFIVSLLDSLANLIRLRWRPGARHAMSWLWNLVHLPSLIAARRRFRPVRALGDEELFRFQARGSVRLREVGAEISGRILSVFDDDQALAKGTRRVWSSPGIWGALIAVLFMVFAARSIIFRGVPNVGASFPLEPPTIAFERWLAGWNESGLGSSSPVHPSIGLTGLVSTLWFGLEGAARTLLTIAFGLTAVVGMGRLAGRLGFRGPGRYLSGLVLLSGPGTALLVGSGSWLGLGAAAFLPWAVRASFVHPDELGRGRLTHIGWALLIGIPVAALSPLLALIPFLVVLLWKITGGRGASLWLSIVVALGAVVAVPFLVGDSGWVLDSSRRLGLVVDDLWPILVVGAFLPLVLMDAKHRRLGGIGAVMASIGLIIVRLPYGGPGFEEAALILASFGAALLIAAGLDGGARGLRRAVAALAAAALLILSVGPLANGSLGLPGGDLNERLSFGAALAGSDGVGRILIASGDRGEIPGEARPGPGFWYRTVDGTGMTLDEVWLPDGAGGDDALEAALERLSTGAELRPGSILAPFAIDWVVLVGPQFRLDEVLVAQLDMVPTPLDPDSRVFDNPLSEPLAAASDGQAWVRDGTGFAGAPGQGRVALAVNHDRGWSPAGEPMGWQSTVAAEDGAAVFAAGAADRWLALAGAILLALALVLVGVGRARR